MREGYKKTMVGVIPEDWEVEKLEKVSEIIMGQSPRSENYNSEGVGLPLIQGNADCINRKTNPRLFTSQITKKCNYGDIIMTVRAPVGAISKSIHKACIGRGVCALRVNENYNNEFLYQYLINFENKWDNLSQGSTFTAVNSKDIKTVKVPLPPLKEQKKIASILSSVDEHIEEVNGMIEDLKELKKGLMQKLLTGQYTLENGKLVKTKEFKKTKLGMIPKDWEVKKLGEILYFMNGKTFKSTDWSKQGLPIIRIQNLNGSNEYNYYNKNDSNKYYVEDGELLFSWSGSIGTSFGPYIWSGSKGILNQHIYKVGLKENNNKEYIYYGLKMITKKIEESTHGSAGIVHITKKQLEMFRIIIPSIQEQEKIALILSSIDKRVEAYKKEKEDLQQLKKGLMQQLLTGKKRV